MIVTNEVIESSENAAEREDAIKALAKYEPVLYSKILELGEFFCQGNKQAEAGMLLGAAITYQYIREADKCA